MRACPPELKTSYRQNRVIPFIGAGISMSIEWKNAHGDTVKGPSWSELASKAASLLGFESLELARVRGTDLQIFEYFMRKNADSIAPLTNWFCSQMQPPDDDLRRSPIHAHLAALDKCRLFYTTNYDDFLERALRLHKRACRAVAVEQEMGQDEGCEVVKFHGDVNHPGQIVLTESHYEKRLSLSTALDLRLRADLLGRVLLFIGYSFRDPNVSYLFRLFTDGFQDQVSSLRGKRAFIVLPEPSDFEQELFDARKISVIGVSKNNMTQDIANILEDMRS